MKVTLVDSVRGIEGDVEMDCIPREGDLVYPPVEFNRALLRVGGVRWDLTGPEPTVRVALVG